VFADQWKDRTIIVGLRGKAAEAERFEQRHGIRFWLLDEEANDDGISEFITRCHAEGIHGVFIEGGAQLLSSFLKQRRIDYLFHYRAPVILADNSALSPFYGYEPSDMQRAIRLRKVRHALFADDQLIHGELVYPE
jgi:diaminohydroxyphosphoribosylaminopyrimidine deaminase/5-amino-6-(5-phosphoribosylamino)uracil reductase